MESVAEKRILHPGTMKLTPKFLLTFTIATVLPIIIIGILSLRSTSQLENKNREQLMTASTAKIAGDAELIIEQTYKDINYLAQTQQIQQTIQSMVFNDKDTLNTYKGTYDNGIELLKTFIRANDQYVKIQIANQQGRIAAQVENIRNSPVVSSNTKGIKSEEYFTEAIKLDPSSFYISPVFIEKQSNIIFHSVYCSVPIFDNNDGSRIGVLVISVNIKRLIDEVKQTEAEHHRIIILDKQGRYIYRTAAGDEISGIQHLITSNNGINKLNRSAYNMVVHSTANLSYNSQLFWKVILLADHNTKELSFESYFLKLLIWSLIIILINVTIGLVFSQRIVGSVVRLRNTLFVLGRGEHPERLESKEFDEIGEITLALNDLVDGLRKTSDFAKEIGEGNFDASYKLLSNSDVLGNSLIEMRNSLRKASEEEEIRKQEADRRSWANQGLAKFGDILRQHTGNVEELAYLIIKELVEYLQAAQSVIFLINDENKDDVFLELKAAFAYDRRKYMTKRVDLGEGLPGRCALEKATIFMSRIPSDYFEISSGLGHSRPKALVLVPLLVNEEIMGVLEIASLNEFGKYQVEFIERVSENVASTIANVKINTRTSKLLEETKIQAEELSSKEEEMRQNMEELKATQEEAARKEAVATGFVNSVNHSIIRADYNIDGMIDYANTKFLDLMEYSSYEVIGKHFSIFFDKKDIFDFTKQWKRVISGGKHIEEEIRFKTKNGYTWMLATFTPIRDISGSVVRVLFLAIDIDHQKTINLDFQSVIAAIERSVIKCEFTPSGNLIVANDLFSGTLGYTKDFFIEFTIFSLLRERDVAKFERTWKKIATGLPFEGSVCMLNAKGEESYFSGTFTAVKDFDGRLSKIVYIAYDITVQRRNEEENKRLLKEANQLTKELSIKEEQMHQNIAQMQYVQEDMARKDAIMSGQLEAINKTMALIEFDLDGNVITANGLFCEIFGYVEPDITGRHQRMFLTERYRNSNEYAKMWEDLRTGHSVEGEFEYVKRDGQIIYVKGTYTPIADAQKRTQKILHLSFDITESKLQQAEITGQINALNRTSAVAEFELNGTLRKANAIFCNLLGYTNEEIVGRNHRMFIPDDIKNSANYTEIWLNLANSHYQEGEFKLVRNDGTEIFVRGIMYPMLNNIGEPYKVIEIAFDITETKKQQNLLQQQAEQMRINEQKLVDALAEAQQKEQEIERANLHLTSNEEEMRQTLEAMLSAQEEMQQKQAELEEAKQLLEKNEQKLRQTIELSVKTNYDLEENNSRLLAAEEELRQNLEELQATQEEMIRQQTEVEEAKVKLEDNESLLKRALDEAEQKRREIELSKEKLLANQQILQKALEQANEKQKKLEEIEQTNKDLHHKINELTVLVAQLNQQIINKA